MRDVPILRRWADEPSEAGSPEARAGQLMRTAGPSEPLSPEALAALEATLQPRLRAPRRAPPVKSALVVLGVLGGATALWQLERPAAPGPVAALQSTTPSAPVPVLVESPPPADEPPPPPAPPRPRVAPTAPRAKTEEQPDPLAAESKLLARAVDQLRNGHDPSAALTTLAEHAQLFPHGALAREVQIATVEALLAQGRRSDALARLEGLELEDMPRGAELEVLHGELLAEAGHCPRAEALFTRALARPRDPAVQERALYGRAGCRGQLNDHDGSQADLQQYLERFPTGRFAADARARLDP